MRENLVSLFRNFSSSSWIYISVFSVLVPFGFMFHQSTKWWQVSSLSVWIIVFMACAIIALLILLCNSWDDDSKRNWGLFIFTCGFLATIAANSEMNTYKVLAPALAKEYQQHLLIKQRADEVAREEKDKLCRSYVGAMTKLDENERMAVLRATGKICDY